MSLQGLRQKHFENRESTLFKGPQIFREICRAEGVGVARLHQLAGAGAVANLRILHF
jgi:hypothetical protein